MINYKHDGPRKALELNRIDHNGQPIGTKVLEALDMFRNLNLNWLYKF